MKLIIRKKYCRSANCTKKVVAEILREAQREVNPNFLFDIILHMSGVFMDITYEFFSLFSWDLGCGKITFFNEIFIS